MLTIDKIVEQAGSQFLTVEFIKKDGSLRKLNGRLGVTKHLKGGKATVDRDKFLILWDAHCKGYRAVNRETITSVSINGLNIYKKESEAHHVQPTK